MEREEQAADTGACFPKQDPERSGGHMISTDDVEYPREYRTLGNGTRRFSNVGLVHTSERRHTVIAAQSLEALTGLQKADMERKRDAFMDHLKNKYPPQHPPSPSPSHGSMRGQPDRVREQQQPNYWSFKTRSPRHSQSTQSGLADQASKLSFASAESLETMSEADIPLGFNRMNRFRQSLPLSRSASQTKLRSPGVLFLQFGDETRRVHITHELSSLDTLHALIVHMFPQKLTMGMLKSPNTAILIKDETRNVFYELEDVRDIQDRSIIKIYRKEPIYASYPTAHLANGDLRREMVYTSRESSPTRRLNNLSSSASPPSGSPSRSRLSYSGGRPPSYAGPPHPHAHHPSSGQPPAGLSPSPSAILERRDVKPDEEVSSKNMVLMKNEGLYADPYSLVHEGRLSIASTQSLAAIGDPFTFPVSGGLYRRGSVRSLSTYSAAALQGELEEALYKPGGPLYSDSYASASTLGMGFRLPPSSPQKIPDVQLRDRDSYSGPPSRASPVRQSFRKDSASSSVFVESPKSRSGSGSDPLCGPGGPSGEGRGTPGYNSPQAANDSETRERMEAMEKQIASLTGLVQSVLTRGPDSDSTEKTETASDGSGTGTGRLKTKALTPSAPSAGAAMPPPPAGATQATAVTRLQMQLHLHDLQQNATDLRDQLSQLRKMQLQNQDSVRSLLKRTETEISVRVTDALRKQEDPLQRQRLLVEEERLKYLNEEELIIQQLHDLEKSVEEIQKDSSVNHRLVTVQELEEKALVLRKLGETLTELKNQFPSLQSKMRVVLRVEVEAVKFLKEEPHRLDALLKRCKTITDTLTTLRRQVNEGIWKGQEDFASQSQKHTDDFPKNTDFDIPTSPPLNFSDLGGSASLSSWTPHSGPGLNPSSTHHDSPQHGPLKNRPLEELSGRRGVDKSVSVEAAERDWEEKRASLTQYSAQDINRLLEETQAELMKAIPDLDFAAKQAKPLAAPTTQSSTPISEIRPSKPQHIAHKLSSKSEPSARRGSDELTVPRYRTEKPSKSPPPPPPRRSFPSSHGLTTTRSGEVIVTSKTIKKSESEETEAQKPHVKLRRTVSEAPRPASTPPVIASGVKDEDDEEKIIAELEVFQRAPVKAKVSPPHSLPSTLRRATPPPSLELWPPGAPGRKLSSAALHTTSLQGELDCLAQLHTCTSSLDSKEQDIQLTSPALRQVPRIVLTEWISAPSSPTESAPIAALEESEQSIGKARTGVMRPLDYEVITASSAPKNTIQPSSTENYDKFPLGGSIDYGAAQDGNTLESHVSQSPLTSMGSLSAQGDASKVSITPVNSPGKQRKPFPWELRIQESFEAEGDVEESTKEELALIITESQVEAVSSEEVQKIIRQAGEEVQVFSVPTQRQEDQIVSRLHRTGEGVKTQLHVQIQLSKTPLIFVFDDPVEIRTAYRQLTLMMEEAKEDDPTDSRSSTGKPLPKPRTVRSHRTPSTPAVSGNQPRIKLPLRQLRALTKALELGLQTGQRTIQVAFSEGKEASEPAKAADQISGKSTHSSSNGLLQRSPPHVVSGPPIPTTACGARKNGQPAEVDDVTLKPNGLTGSEQHRGRKVLSADSPEVGHEPRGTDVSEARSQEIRKSTYQQLDSLEETIRELESTLQEISTHPSAEYLFSKEFLGQLGTADCETPLGAVSGAAEQTSGLKESLDLQSQSRDQEQASLTRKKPPVPPKPASLPLDAAKTGGGSSGSSKGLHSATSRLKNIQQSSPEKSKAGKQREDFLKIQGQQQPCPVWVSTLLGPQFKALGSSSSSSSSVPEPVLSNTKTVTFSGSLSTSSGLPSSSTVFAPGLKKYPQDGAASSFSASSSPAKTLFSSLSASSLSTEALLSSTFRRRLVKEQRTSSAPLPQPNGRPASTASASPTSSSPLSSLSLSSLGLKTARTLQYAGLHSFRDRGSKTLPKPSVSTGDK
nr:PREDICTED: SRC kinase signaling inhibitor 1 isoform X1 [Lepisosteus oculatus]